MNIKMCEPSGFTLKWYQCASRRSPTHFVPTRMDVLFGRGRPIQQHPGNIRLQMITEIHKARYQRSDKGGKTMIAAEVTKAIKACGNSPGRFLKRKDEMDEESPWIAASEDEINTKVRHGLRSKIRTQPWPTTKHFAQWRKKDTAEAKENAASPPKDKRKTPVDKLESQFYNVYDDAIDNVLSTFQESYVKSIDAKRRKVAEKKSEHSIVVQSTEPQVIDIPPLNTEFSVTVDGEFSVTDSGEEASSVDSMSSLTDEAWHNFLCSDNLGWNLQLKSH